MNFLNTVQDNVWAFALFALATLMAMFSGVLAMLIVFKFHSTDTSIAKDMIQFAGTIAMTGAALFHGKEKTT